MTPRSCLPGLPCSQRYLTLSHGFTLVELLVVLLIIGFGINFINFNVAGNNAYRLRTEAKNFANNTSLMSEEAVLSNQQWGVDFFYQQEDDVELYGYRWLVRNDDGFWLEANSQVRQAEFIFSPGTALRLELDGLREEQIIELKRKIIDPSAALLGGGSDNEEPVLPDIWLLSSGEMSAFRLNLFDQENPDSELLVRGDELGRITVGAEAEEDDERY